MKKDLVAAVERSVRDEQSSLRVAPGQLWLRGTELALVVKVGEGEVAWLSEAGEPWSMTSAEFRSRALTLVAEVGAEPPPYLERAWQVAKARDIPPDLRILSLGRLAAGAPTGEDRVTITGWVRALQMDEEPKR